MPELAFLSVEELSKRLEAKSITSLALTDEYLGRIEKLAKPLNCFVTVTADRAREDAKRADAETAAGKRRGPLHGIPYALKDLVDTKGIRTTWGAKPYAERVPETDAVVVNRLRDAGSVLLGKTSMIELAGGLGYHWADAAFNGPCRTPWDLDRWAGGSSSGSGSAVGAGLCAFAIGSETWGSILCPSAFNGVTGLRPTYGVVPRTGAMALSWSFDKLGPIVRYAGDAAMVLQAIAGRDAGDPASVDPPKGLGFRGGAQKAPRLAWLPPPADAKYDKAGIDAIHEAALEAFRAAGATIETVTLPALPYESAAFAMLSCDVRSAFEHFLAEGLHSQLADRSHREGKTMADYPHPTGADYVKAQRVRRIVQEQMETLLGKYDGLLAPNFLAPPPLVEKNIDEQLPGSDPLGAAGALCGLPAMAFPAGLLDGKLPISLQVVGRTFEDAKVVAIASLFQSKTDWHQRRPPRA